MCLAAGVAVVSTTHPSAFITKVPPYYTPFRSTAHLYPPWVCALPIAWCSLDCVKLFEAAEIKKKPGWMAPHPSVSLSQLKEIFKAATKLTCCLWTAIQRGVNFSEDATRSHKITIFSFFLCPPPRVISILCFIVRKNMSLVKLFS